MIYFPGSNELSSKSQWIISQEAMSYFTGKMISEWFISQAAMNYFTDSNDLSSKSQWIISQVAMNYLPSSNELFHR